MEIKFLDFGESMGTRKLGEKIRKNISKSIVEGENVTFNFEGVRIVSNSFADECFGKLMDDFDFKVIKERTRFSNLNNDVRFVIKGALQKNINR